MSDHASQRKYVGVLAAVAAGILVFGSMLKPEKEAPQVSISEAERLQTQQLRQKRSLQEMSSYFASTARNLAAHVVWLTEAQASGVIWDEGGLIVTADPEERPVRPFRAILGGTTFYAEPFAFAPAISLAVLQAPQDQRLRPARHTVESRLEPGAWIVQVGRQSGGGHLFTPGIYSGTVPSFCGDFAFDEVQTNLPLHRAMLGGGLFDVDGNLLAVVLRCAERYVAVAPSSVREAIQQADALPSKLLHRYGFRAAPLNSGLRAHFGVNEGALVTEVWNGRLAEMAGLKPGDIIVKLEGDPVADPDDLARLALPPVYPTLEITVLRGRRTVTVPLPAEAHAVLLRGQADSGSGIVLQPTQGGFPVQMVEPRSPADLAGVQPGDVLLEADGKPLTGPQAASRVLAAGATRPSYIVVQRGQRKLGFLLR